MDVGEARLDSNGDVTGRRVFVGAAFHVERFHLYAVTPFNPKQTKKRNDNGTVREHQALG